MTTARLGLLAAALAGAFAGCAHGRMLPGTSIPATDENRAILEALEQYRQNLATRNVEGLLLLASEDYFEDGGTPQASDDYGYEGLRQVLTGRLGRIRSIRYDIQYRSIAFKEGRAEVDVFLNGAFELESEVGERYRRVNDMHRFILVRQPGSSQWRFLSGM